MAADHAELKHLQRRLDETHTTIKALKGDRQALDDKIRKEQALIDKLQVEINKLKNAAANNGKLVVSEHAMLRYFERVLKFDLNEIKNKIVPEKLLVPIRTIGNGVYPTDTHKVKIRDGVVITIITPDDNTQSVAS